MQEGLEGRPQLLLVRAVARNRSFRLANSFIRFKASFSEIAARRGRSTLISFEVFNFFMPLFCIHLRISQSSRRTLRFSGSPTQLNKKAADGESAPSACWASCGLRCSHLQTALKITSDIDPS